MMRVERFFSPGDLEEIAADYEEVLAAGEAAGPDLMRVIRRFVADFAMGSV